MTVSLWYQAVSIRSLQEAGDTATQGQLRQCRENIDRLITDVERVATSLANDHEVNSCPSESRPLSAIQYHDLRRISERIAPYVFGNAILGHTFVYRAKSDLLVFENGYGRFEDVDGSLLSVEGFTAEE